MSYARDAAAKRRRFSASAVNLTTGARTNNAHGDGSQLVATIRRWGSTYGIFDDGARSDSLWQLQIAHGGSQSFGYHLLQTSRDALLQHPNANVRNLVDLEKAMHIKILNGAPPQTGPADPDSVGLEAWLPVVYAPTPNDGMDIIKFILQHKVGAGHTVQMPKLIAVFPDEEAPEVPEPWVVQNEHALQLPTFKALPPRTRRHLLMQVELEQSVNKPEQQGAQQQDTERRQSSYHVMFFGGIYPFKELFDAANVQGGLVPQPDGTKDEYVRHLRVTHAERDKDRLTTILDEVLLGTPVYLIDETEEEGDELIRWLLEQPSVELGERSMPSS